MHVNEFLSAAKVLLCFHCQSAYAKIAGAAIQMGQTHWAGRSQVGSSTLIAHSETEMHAARERLGGSPSRSAVCIAVHPCRPAKLHRVSEVAKQARGTTCWLQTAMPSTARPHAMHMKKLQHENGSKRRAHVCEHALLYGAADAEGGDVSLRIYVLTNQQLCCAFHLACCIRQNPARPSVARVRTPRQD